MFEEGSGDPVLDRAIERAQKALAKAKRRWPGESGDEDEDEAADDAAIAGRDALTRLQSGAWDEAEALAQSAVELDESWRDGESWREFAILVEEAAAIGRARPG